MAVSKTNSYTDSTTVTSDTGTLWHLASNNSLAVIKRRGFFVLRALEQFCTITISLTIIPFALSVFSILTMRRVQRILLAIAVLNIPLQFEKHFFLIESASKLGSLGGLQISLTNISLTGLYVAWLIEAAIRPGLHARQRRILGKLTPPALLLLFFNTVSLLVAGSVTLGVFQVWSVLVLFLLYMYVAKMPASRDDVVFIVRLLLIGLVGESILMLAQAGGLVGNIQFLGIKARSVFAGDTRVSGTIGSPNPAAAYLVMMMMVAVGVMLADVRRVDKYLAGSGFALACVPLIFTLSRGGWIAFFVGLVTIITLGARRIPKTVVAAVVVFVFMIIPFRNVISVRLYSDDNGSAAARMPLNDLAGDMIANHPLLGVGANNFALAMGPYLEHKFSGDFIYTVHNTYLLVWTETGIGGLIAFLWFLFAIVRQGFWCWHSRDPLFAPLALGCVAAVIAFMVQMNFDPYRAGAAVDLMWLSGGLITAMTRLSIAYTHVPRARGIVKMGMAPVKILRA